MIYLLIFCPLNSFLYKGIVDVVLIILLSLHYCYMFCWSDWQYCYNTFNKRMHIVGESKVDVITGKSFVISSIDFPFLFSSLNFNPIA